MQIASEHTLRTTIDALELLCQRADLRHKEMDAQFGRLDDEHPTHEDDQDCAQCDAIYALIGQRRALGLVIRAARELAEDLKAYLPETQKC